MAVWTLRDDEAGALRDSRCLVDVRAFSAHEELSLELRVAGDVVEGDT